MISVEDIRKSQTRSVSLAAFPGVPSHGNSYELLTMDDLSELSTNLQVGLTMAAVRERRLIYGPNDITANARKTKRLMLTGRFDKVWLVCEAMTVAWGAIRTSMLARFLEQFKNPLIMLLLASASISLLMGQVENCVSIALVHR